MMFKKLLKLFSFKPEKSEIDTTDPLLRKFCQLIATVDSPQIELRKDHVESFHLPALAQHYNGLEDWDQKACVLYLVDFHREPVLKSMAMDYLKAPLEADKVHYDHRFLAKISALRILDNQYEDIDYSNFRGLQETLSKFMVSHGIKECPE